jgi:hypothetical protein
MPCEALRVDRRIVNYRQTYRPPAFAIGMKVMPRSEARWPSFSR